MTGPGPAALRSRPAAALLLAIAVGVGAWAVINSPLFEVGTVVVRGARHLQPEHIRALARIEEGTNLIRLSLEDVAARVERDPWVARATPWRDLPSTLVIEVLERRACGWMDDGRGGVVLAGDGTVLERAGERPGDLPSLGRTVEGLAPGEPVPSAPPALTVAAALAPDVLGAIAAASGDETGVVLELRGGGRVLVGEPERLREKARALRELLAWAEERGIAIDTIDVRLPSAPTVLPVGARTRSSPVASDTPAT